MRGTIKMSYAVIHMQKIKSGGLKGIQIHNERQKEHSHSNPDIDFEKTKNNYDLHAAPNSYNKAVKKRIEELNLPKAIRKDATVLCGFVCTSDKAFFDNLSKDERNRFFKESYNFLKNRYGEKNIISAKVHLDETTPHLHCYIVPVTKNNRLSARDIFTRTELKNLQTNFHAHLQDKGFDIERGKSSERRHLSVEEYKDKTNYQFKQIEIEVKNKIKDLEIQRDIVKNDLNALKNDFNKVDALRVDFDKINALKGKFGVLNKGKVTISTKDFEELKNIAKKQQVFERKIQVLENENQNLKKELVKYKGMDARMKEIQREKKIVEMSKELDILKKYLVETNQIDKVKNFSKSLTKNQKNEKVR